MRFRLALRPLLLTMVAMAVGCGGSGGGADPGNENPEILFINGSVDAGNVEFRLNEDRVVTALPYGSSSGPRFRSIKKDSFDVFLKAEGASEDAWAEVLDAAAEANYVVTAYGLRNYGDELFKRLRFLRFDADRTIPNGNKARLFVINALNRSTGFDNVPIDFKNPGENPQFQVSSVGFGTVATLLVDSGEQTFDVRLSGAERVFVSKTLSLGSGKVYVALVGGTEEESGAAAPDIRLIEIPTKRD